MEIETSNVAHGCKRHGLHQMTFSNLGPIMSL